MDRTYCCSIHGLAGYSSCNAKISYFHISISGNDHILRLDIPVDDVLLMSSCDSLRHLDSNADCLFIFKKALLFDVAFLR